MVRRAETQLFKKAINTFGSDEQIRVAQEECAELIVAISKCHRYAGRESVLDNLKEEIADVQIMLDQLQIIFEITDTDLAEIRTQKLRRLKDRIG